MEEITEYLKLMVEMTAKRAPSEWRYKGVYDLVLQNGQAFDYAPCPDDVKIGPPKACYQTAFNLAMGRDDLIYVEGYAVFIFSVDHAWCVSRDGIVIDPTWNGMDSKDQERVYFGIPFQREYVRQAILDAGIYGVLWLGGMVNLPLLEGAIPATTWLEKMT